MLRSFAGGILATLAPYSIYHFAQNRYGLHASLANLTPGRLLVLMVAYSVASPLLRHLWFALQGRDNLVPGLMVMLIGDLSGSLLVIYTVKAALPLQPSDLPRAH